MLRPIEVKLNKVTEPTRGILLLDRDGVINRKNPHGYVTSWEEFEFLPGSLRALRRARDLSLSVRIVSNQSCVGRGLTPVEDVVSVMETMSRCVQDHGGRMDQVFFCPHQPQAGCNCRKPKPGLLHAALSDVPASSDLPVFLIGDSGTDIEAGRAVHAHTLLVDPDLSLDDEPPAEPEALANDLDDALLKIEGFLSGSPDSPLSIPNTEGEVLL